MEMDDEKRHIELSSKIFDMGEALINEGESKEDSMVTNAGNIMMLVSGLLYDSKDMTLFTELCDMFSAKKLMDSQIELGPLSNMGEDELFRMIGKLRKDIEDDLDNNNEDEDDEEE